MVGKEGSEGVDAEGVRLVCRLPRPQDRRDGGPDMASTDGSQPPGVDLAGEGEKLEMEPASPILSYFHASVAVDAEVEVESCGVRGRE